MNDKNNSVTSEICEDDILSIESTEKELDLINYKIINKKIKLINYVERLIISFFLFCWDLILFIISLIEIKESLLLLNIVTIWFNGGFLFLLIVLICEILKDIIIVVKLKKDGIHIFKN